MERELREWYEAEKEEREFAFSITHSIDEWDALRRRAALAADRLYQAMKQREQGPS